MTSLPNGWEQSTVGQVCGDVKKVDPRAEPLQPFHYIDISGVDGETGSIVSTQRLDGADAPSRARQLVAEGDVVVSTVRTYMRKTALVPFPLHGAVASTGFSVLRPTEAILPRLLLHAVRHPDFVEALSALQTGSSYPAVRNRDVRDMAIRVPPQGEQQRIVAAIEEAFSKLDAGEAGLRTVGQLLKRMRDAILAAAVTGRLVPQDPTDIPAAKLLADLGVDPICPPKDEFAPQTWAWVRLGDVASIGGGIQKQPKRSPSENPLPFLRVANVGRGVLDLTEVHQIEVFHGELARFGLARGDLLVVEGNGSPDQIGRSALWHGEIHPCVHQNHLIRVRPSPTLDPAYLELFWNSPSAARRVQGVASSTSGLHTLSTGKLKGLPVVLPPIEEQRQIVGEVDRQMSFIQACERAVDAGLERSAALRRSVLKAAFEGRLVPQDPTDEPASVLLERIRAERASSPKPKARRARSTS